MTSEDAVVIHSAGTWETWLLNVPPVNAIGPYLLEALGQALTRVEQDADICGVLIGSQLRVFSAGADAKWMSELYRESGPEGLVDRFKEAMDLFRSLCLRMRRSDLLFVAVLEGHTLAGGLELAAACDLRFAADSDDIRIGVPEMEHFGALPSGGGGVQYLARIMRPSDALAFVLEGTPCSPKEALKLGLVDRLYPPTEARAAANDFLSSVTAKAGRVGTRAAKRAIWDSGHLGITEAIAADSSIHWDAIRRGRFLTGVGSFIDRYS